jgi:hypothetical protein
MGDDTISSSDSFLDLERELGAILDTTDWSDYRGIDHASSALDVSSCSSSMSASDDGELMSSACAVVAADGGAPEPIEIDSEDEQPSLHVAKKYRLTGKFHQSMLCNRGRHNLCFGRCRVGILTSLLGLLSQMPHIPDQPDLDGCEFFAGVQSVTRGFTAANFKMMPFDITYHPGMDMGTSLGFMLALELVTRTRPNGVCFFAPPCSTYVWMNRGTSGRSREQPLGRLEHPSVRQANLVTARTCLLIVLCIAKGIHWIVEQPSSSVMVYGPEMDVIKHHYNMVEVKTWMGAFGAASPKATVLYSSSDWINAMQRSLDRTKLKKQDAGKNLDIARQYVDTAGRRRVQGGHGLKATQAYPDGFGVSLAAEYKARAYGNLPPFVTPWADLPNPQDWEAAAQLDLVFSQMAKHA